MPAKKTETPIVVRKLGPTIWEAQSESNPDKWYQIDLTIPKCMCADWSLKINAQKKNGNPEPYYHCKHLGEVVRQGGKVKAAATQWRRTPVAAPDMSLSKEEVERRVEALKERFRKK